MLPLWWNFLSVLWAVEPGMDDSAVTCSRLPVWTLACALLAGCTAHYPVNESISTAGQPKVAPSLPDSAEERSDTLLVGLTFSGGGTRAAAFSYGVLEVLNDVVIQWDGRERRLVGEVDVISSVSGGSFTSAYYGLFGHRIFDDYAEKFLYKDVQGHLEWSLLSPVEWTKLGSSHYDRSEMAADYYDEILFEGKTLGDVVARNGPRLDINASEIALGAQFTFGPAQFDLICSDYASFPMSRAVTASSAVPILFSSVVVNNYAGDCPVDLPAWAKAAEQRADPTERAYHLVTQMRKFSNREQLPYLHLLDGGLTDNLGVRPFLNRLTLAGTSWDLAKDMGQADVHRMLVVVVNAESEMNVSFRESNVDMSLFDAITAATSIPLNEYTFDSLTLLRLAFDGIANQFKKGRCEAWAATRKSTEGCDDFEFYFVVVEFDKLVDRKESQRLKHLPTSFYLPVEDVNALRHAAREIMTESRDFQKFMRDMQGSWSPAAD